MSRPSRVATAALSSQLKSTAHVRHKCFVSYHHEDEDEVADFIEEYDDVFIARALGVSDADDDLVESTDTDYVMRVIRERYLTDSTVTLVMIGECTWARRYVDWEIASTLRDDTNNKRSGLLGIRLSSLDSARVPPRLLANRPAAGEGYARYIHYPSAATSLRSWIDDAFSARTSSDRAADIDNSADLFKNNRKCP